MPSPDGSGYPFLAVFTSSVRCARVPQKITSLDFYFSAEFGQFTSLEWNEQQVSDF